MGDDDSIGELFADQIFINITDPRQCVKDRLTNRKYSNLTANANGVDYQFSSYGGPMTIALKAVHEQRLDFLDFS